MVLLSNEYRLPVLHHQTFKLKKRIQIATDVIPYHSSHQQGPAAVRININQVIKTIPETTQRARLIDFGWILCQQPLEDSLFALSAEHPQVIPAWTAFNIKIIEGRGLRESCVGYCPVIEASPTELPTVYTILQRSLQMADQLGQRDVIVVFDQAIYAKALEIVWQNPQEFQCVVLRMGTFHTVCAFLAAIGKRFSGARLEDVLIESGIVATGSVSGVLQGKHYNRAIRTHKVKYICYFIYGQNQEICSCNTGCVHIKACICKNSGFSFQIVFEALHRLQWQQFKGWLVTQGQCTNYIHLVSALQLVREE